MQEADETFLKAIDTPRLCDFGLELGDGRMIHCREVVRVVTGKRIVCRGQWSGLEVYAKIFLGPQAQRYAHRDRRGMEALGRAGILAPEVLYAGGDKNGKAQVLVFAAIEDGVNAEDFWHASASSPEKKHSLAKSLVTTVALHHEAGLLQTDLYLKNFLLKGNRIYTLDGDAIQQLPQLFAQRAALNNLALLLSKFDVVDQQAGLPELLEAYAQARRWSDAPDVDLMTRRIAAIRGKVAGKYAEHKVFRECSDIHVRQTNSQYRAVARSYASPKLLQALDDMDALLSITQVQRLKSGNTCTVGLTEIDGLKVVVKRYNIKSFLHGLNRALRQSRAAISWTNAHRLKMHGIATAAPIALVEKRMGWIRREAYYLAEYVDAPDIREFFADRQKDPVMSTGVAHQVARLFYKLHLLGISHGDFKATNVKVAAGEPLLIDLDSMRRHRCRWMFERQHVRDLRRFLRNWSDDVETKALLAHALKQFYKDPRPLVRAGWL